MSSFKFIDLFAGIGGFRIAFEKAGGNCVFSSEWDKFAQITYEAFFGEKPDFAHIKKTNPPGDITQIDPKDIPDHDILVGGFPCQPFSLAGVSKKRSLGKAHGFEDPTQGTLFFNIKEIIKKKQPKAFLLENVKHLRRHDKGRTYKVIHDTLREYLGYTFEPAIIDGAGWVPQHRERIFMIGFHPSLKIEEGEFQYPPPPKSRITLDKILENEVDSKYTLCKGTWDTLLRHKKHHEEAGNGFGYGLITKPFENKITRTISARYHKDGAEVLIDQTEKERPRRLTPLECSRLMGFPEEYQKVFSPTNNIQPVSDTQAYRQFGNSVIVPLVTDIASMLINFLQTRKII